MQRKHLRFLDHLAVVDVNAATMEEHAGGDLPRGVAGPYGVGWHRLARHDGLPADHRAGRYPRPLQQQAVLPQTHMVADQDVFAGVDALERVSGIKKVRVGGANPHIVNTSHEKKADNKFEKSFAHI